MPGKPKSLTDREFYAVLVATRYTAGRRDETDEIIRRGIRRQRIRVRLFEELFLHLSLLLGFPAMLDGLARLREISSPAGGSSVGKIHSQQRLTHRGRVTLGRIYGMATPRLLGNLAKLHSLVPAVIVRDAYGRIISRRGMSLQEREIVNVVVLSMQGLDRQLYSHLRGALRVGVSPAKLRDAIAVASHACGRALRSPLRMLASLSLSVKRSS